MLYALLLTLSLFMFWVLADDIDHAATTNDFALVTHLFDTCLYFHTYLTL